MKLYYDPISTTSRPVLLMVETMRMPIELQIIDILSGEQRSEDYLAINPKGLVPALEVDEGFVLTECAAILRYLAGQFAPSLYPSEPRERARVDEMISWFSTDLHLFLDVMTVYPRSFLAGAFSEGTTVEMAAFAGPHVAKDLTLLDRQLSAQAFVAGDVLTIADFLGVAIITLADLIAFDFSPWPSVMAWVSRMRVLPGWDVTFAAFEGWRAAHLTPPPS
ncbi:glutathione S-transferase family protein [Aureimonas phyllosphaerae]|uniref:Glutathione S-transferase n=1 Tax=Aureimonas phyllosphaerae TaxID=1166078 RepID=A0A7W6BXP2_9HYPH|nr:glutathione S-transferase family protein [Aureimonas phyllosphaerae]MBB3938330.1 glutathione S-transferase [Aureimonas phyllosphaerae]MBB3962338.1 glutathione S-transferase [Aureimonas phyllosphaerae]